MSKHDRGRFDHAIYSAPYAGGRLPISPRTGRMTSQNIAEAEYAQAFDGIAIAEHAPPGLWDYGQEARERVARGSTSPIAAGRYDDRIMRTYADARSHELSPRELEVFTLFWVGRLSYSAIARQLGLSRKRVENCVLEIRAKARRQ